VDGRRCYEILGRREPCPDCATSLAVRSKRRETIERYSPELQKYIECTSSPILNGEGEVELIIERLHDITDRKAAESALRRSEAEKAAILNSMPVMLAYYDTDMRVLYANKISGDSVGSLPEDLIGRHCYEIWYGRTDPCENCPLIRSLATGEVEEEVVTTPDGRTFHLRGCPVYDEKGGIAGLIEFAMDITEQKATEEAIHAANKKLRILSGITRHDILNQVMALQGFLQFAEEKSIDPEQAGYLSEVKKAAKAMERQIEFTRSYEELGMEKPAWSAFSTMIEGINDTRLPIRHECDGYEVLADPMIEKVFANLMENTRNHAEGATGVEIRCEIRDGNLIIIWEDDGPGVPDAEKEDIFQRGIGKHTGLGLFLSREILAITGITICENGIYGKGARFEMQVPKEAWRGNT